MAKALYSVPGELIGQRILARADGSTVKLYWRSQLIKVHPHQSPGRRHTVTASRFVRDSGDFSVRRPS